jgi:peptidoglycan hydrolase-like protein with peptidoglycan-binding domain
MYLSIGSIGPAVRNVQLLLNFLVQPDTPLKEDGIFGPKTQAVGIEFQKIVGLVTDGIVGPRTAAAMATFAVASFLTESYLYGAPPEMSLRRLKIGNKAPIA